MQKNVPECLGKLERFINNALALFVIANFSVTLIDVSREASLMKKQ